MAGVRGGGAFFLAPGIGDYRSAGMEGGGVGRAGRLHFWRVRVVAGVGEVVLGVPGFAAVG